MKGIVIVFAFIFSILCMLSAAFSDLDLTPDNNSIVQSTQQPAGLIPLAPTPGSSASGGGQQTNSTDNSPIVRLDVPMSGIPVTGGACPENTVVSSTGACVTTSIPVTGGEYIEYIPITGVYGISYIPVTSFIINSIPVTGLCANPYVVHHGDTLSKLARTCGTSVGAILSLNPIINNPDLIYPGQVFWLYPVTTIPASIPVTGGTDSPTITVPVFPVTINPLLAPIPTGTTVQVTISNFPANVPVSIGIGRTGSGYQVVNQGITDSNGILQTTVKIPSENDGQNTWVVLAIADTNPPVQAQSNPFEVRTGN